VCTLNRKTFIRIRDELLRQPLLLPFRILADYGQHALKDDFDRRNIVTLSPLMTHLLSDQRVTAIICANDQVAQIVWEWLMAADIPVPGDMSLISFDNSPKIQTWPVDSISFGFEGLGYAAFHAIAGDIPIRKATTTTIASTPAVARRGSVGTPRRRPLPLSFRPILPRRGHPSTSP
jgi:hypothetical protein